MELLPDTLGHVADLGCGPGIMVPLIRERGGTFTGVDLSPEMISAADERYGSLPGVSFVVGNTETLDLPDESVDQIVCMGVIEYLESPQKAFAEMGRILRPGGVAVVSVSRRIHTDALARPLTAPVRWVARRLGFSGSGQVHRAGMQPREFEAAAAVGGLVPEAYSNYGFTPAPYPLTRIAPALTMRTNLPFERFHDSRNPVLTTLARGYLCRFRKPDAGRQA
jgi:ArsR family transcriptional regulator